MNINAPITRESGHFHAVRFYDNAASLVALVSQFVTEGFLADLPAVVIATPEHRAALMTKLHAAGFDTERLQASDKLILLNAEDVLAEFMVDGMPDPGRFRRTLVPVIERACKGNRECVIRAYGEMVDVLWKAGHTVAATKLEMLWNDLAQSHAFSLLCGYSMGNFYKDTDQRDIKAQHTHFLPHDDETTSRLPA